MNLPTLPPLLLPLIDLILLIPPLYLLYFLFSFRHAKPCTYLRVTDLLTAIPWMSHRAVGERTTCMSWNKVIIALSSCLTFNPSPSAVNSIRWVKAKNGCRFAHTCKYSTTIRQTEHTYHQCSPLCQQCAPSWKHYRLGALSRCICTVLQGAWPEYVVHLWRVQIEGPST